MELDTRDTQTQVKHVILAQYLDAWSGIIFNGLANKLRASGRRTKFVYVDCFAHKGRYSGDTHDVILNQKPQDIYGSPIIGIRSLDKLAENAQKRNVGNVEVNAILIEKDRRIFETLLESLSLAQLGSRIKKTTDFSQLKPGEIAVVNEDCLNLRDQLLAYTIPNYTWAFYFLDPYGPSGIPYDLVQSIVKKPRHDVMINFPYLDLHRQLHRDQWTRVYNGESWKNLESEQELASLYRKVLKDMDAGLSVKLVDLQFPAHDRTMFYLFLTTHDPTGALKLNEILDKAKYLEYELRYRLWFAKKTAPPPGQLPLIPASAIEPTIPEKTDSQRPEPEEIAEDVLSRLSGKRITRRQVYQALADELYFPNEVDKALKLLKKNGKAKFEGDLKHETMIEFLNS
jgi:three-Cys-motif partner protein